jgi:hypothetical protein
MRLKCSLSPHEIRRCVTMSCNCTHTWFAKGEVVALPVFGTVDVVPHGRFTILQLEHGNVLSQRIYVTVSSTVRYIFRPAHGKSCYLSDPTVAALICGGLSHQPCTSKGISTFLPILGGVKHRPWLVYGLCLQLQSPWPPQRRASRWYLPFRPVAEMIKVAHSVVERARKSECQQFKVLESRGCHDTRARRGKRGVGASLATSHLRNQFC